MITGLAIIVAIVVGALISVVAGIVVAAVLAAIGLVLLLREARGSLPGDIERAPTDRGAHRILVVANETIERRALLDEVAGRAEKRSRSEILLVCPALAETAPPAPRLRHRRGARRGGTTLRALRSSPSGSGGIHATGVVGDEDPVAAATDAAHRTSAPTR